MSFLPIATLQCSKNPAKDPQTLFIAIGSAPKTLDPRHATDANGMRLAHLLYSGLVRLGGDSSIQADAAHRWTYKKRKYTFELHANLRFSNGRKVTKEDLLFSFQEYRKSPAFQSLLTEVQDIQVHPSENPKTSFVVTISLKRFLASFLSDLTVIKILPKPSSQNRTSLSTESYGEVPLGSGSYSIQEANSTQLILRKNKNNHWVPAKLERLAFKIIGDSNTLYLKTIKGEIDISQAELPLNKVTALEKHSTLKIYRSSGPSMNYILLNLRDKKLRSLKVRKALSQSIRREDIIRFKFNGLAQLAGSILPVYNPFHDPETKLKETQLLKESELKSIVASLKSENYKLTLKTSNHQEASETGRVLVNQLKEAGFQIEQKTFDWGTFYSDVNRGDFQLATMRWVGAVDPDIYRIAFHSGQFPPGRNRGYYHNKAIDQILEKAPSIESFERRKALYREVQKTILNELPIIPLWYPDQVSIVHSRVLDYHPSANGDFSPFLQVHKR